MSFAAFARSFVEAGGRHAFGVTGGGPSIELIDALIGAGAGYVPVAHETTAGLMAGACVRQTGRPVLAIAIKGPGFMNLAPALLSNAYEGFASLSISATCRGVISLRSTRRRFAISRRADTSTDSSEETIWSASGVKPSSSSVR